MVVCYLMPLVTKWQTTLSRVKAVVLSGQNLCRELVTICHLALGLQGLSNEAFKQTLKILFSERVHKVRNAYEGRRVSTE